MLLKQFSGICHFLHKGVVTIMNEKNVICSKTQHIWTVLRISRLLFLGTELFAGHVVGFLPMKRKKMRRMIK